MQTVMMAALAATAALGMGSAVAATLDANFSIDFAGTWITVATWQQSSSPTPITVTNAYAEVPISNWSTDTLVLLQQTSILYGNSSSGNSFSFSNNPYVFVGPQVYKGTDSAPFFPASMTLGSIMLDGDAFTSRLTLGRTSGGSFDTPEPSTWALLLVAFAGACIAGRASSRPWRWSST